MARIGDYINAGLNTYEPGDFLRGSALASASIGQSLQSGVGAITDAMDKQKKDKEDYKTGKNLANAMKLIAPEMAAGLESYVAAMDAEDSNSQKGALGRNIAEYINMGLDKQRNDALLGLQVKQLGLDERRLAETVRQFDAEQDLTKTSARAKDDYANNKALGEALSRYSAIKESEEGVRGLPKMEQTESLIGRYLDKGDGPQALAAVDAYEKARINQMEGATGPKLGSIAVPGGTQDVFIYGTNITDLNGSPLNSYADTPGLLPPPPENPPIAPDGSLPPIPDANTFAPQGPRVPARNPIGFKPAVPVGQRTPEDILKAQLEIKKLEGDISKQGNDVAIADRANSAAVEKGKQALASLKEIRNHPGRWAATGKTSYLPSVRGSDSYDFEQKLEKAKALAGTIGIEAMRGLGAMSEKEFEAAKASIAQLEKGQKTETIEKELDSLIKLFEAKIGESTPISPAADYSSRLRGIR